LRPFPRDHGWKRTLAHSGLDGRQIYSQPRSTFFFIPLSVWPIILGVLGAGIVIVCQLLLMFN
jgi:hypothetical protein